jgi:hypothetical protein
MLKSIFSDTFLERFLEGFLEGNQGSRACLLKDFSEDSWMDTRMGNQGGFLERVQGIFSWKFFGGAQAMLENLLGGTCLKSERILGRILGGSQGGFWKGI